MPISTRLFNDQAITRFNRITSDIQQTQDKIATGKKVLKASDDPVAAANISFVRDQKVMLDRFATNIDRAQTRLTLTENVVAESVNLLTRAYELGIQAKNDTLTAVDRRAISFEISQIRERSCTKSCRYNTGCLGRNGIQFRDRCCIVESNGGITRNNVSVISHQCCCYSISVARNGNSIGNHDCA